MIKQWRKSLIYLVFIGLMWTCIDPYSPDFRNSESLLVVDALLTNENRSYTVKLSRTSYSQYAEANPVTGASVTIRDENGTISLFAEASEGIYKSDSTHF